MNKDKIEIRLRLERSAGARCYRALWVMGQVVWGEGVHLNQVFYCLSDPELKIRVPETVPCFSVNILYITW